MFFIVEPVLVPSPPQSCSRPLCRQWPVSTTVQVMFGGLKIILCVYRVLHRLPSFSLAHAPVEHILTCLLKSALQSSTFYCNKSPKSFFYTFFYISDCFSQGTNAPLHLHRHLWIDAFRSQLFHLLKKPFKKCFLKAFVLPLDSKHVLLYKVVDEGGHLSSFHIVSLIIRR